MPKIDKSLAAAATKARDVSEPAHAAAAGASQVGHVIKKDGAIHRTTVNLHQSHVNFVDDVMFRHKKRTGKRASLSDVIRTALGCFAELQPEEQSRRLLGE